MKNNRRFSPEKSWIFAASLAGLIAGALLISGFLRASNNYFLCSSASSTSTKIVSEYSVSPIQLEAILHYATSKVTPQQSLEEITVSYNVLKSISPCNFLVFGLGHDSLMWRSLNPRGKTLFLEEDPKWVEIVLGKSPDLNAHTVNYRTKLSEADELMSTYKSEPLCSPNNAVLRGNDKCRLALSNLESEFYETEWDVIMIDAPKGYFPEAPGRMAAIFSAAVMARHRKGSGVTHVYLHDVDRKVEKEFAMEFLCRKFLKDEVGRLWHFEIPPNETTGDQFC
ncbi:hypothetical protein ACFE04_025160 [Oxalis oulophora]